MLNRERLNSSNRFSLASCMERPSTTRSYSQGARPHRTRHTHLEILRPFHRIKSPTASISTLRNVDVVGVGDPTLAPFGDSTGSLATSPQSACLKEVHRRSLAKALSWRSIASIDTFALSFLITGSVKMAGSISAVELATKILLFYFHERTWTLIPWGRR